MVAIGNYKFSSPNWLLVATAAFELLRGFLLIAFGKILYDESGGVFAFAFTLVGEVVFVILLQNFAGNLVDRFGALKLLLLSVNILIVASSLTVFFGTFYISNIVYSIILFSIILSVFKPFYRVSRFSYISIYISTEDRESFNRRSAFVFQLSQLTGVILAGLLLDVVSYKLVFIISIFLLMLFGFSLHNVKRNEELKKNENMLDLYRENLFLFLLNNKVVVMCLLVAAIDFALINMFNLILAPYVDSYFDGRTIIIALIDTFFALGAIVFTFFCERKKISFKLNLGMTISSVLSFVTFLFVLFAVQYISSFLKLPVILLAAAVFGALVTLSTVAWNTFLQGLGGVHLKGRMASLKLTAIAILNAFILSSVMNYSVSIQSTSILFFFVCCVLAIMVIPLWKACGYSMDRLYIRDDQLMAVK
ncbi:MFS transporter [Microbulbifer sp.]|uniref:MFS transporter n=1 Tax=Microbulbifer sp. TaxID=1908541 RepID=UPI0025885613|nr:MFS transporter [Microbulbifer sp.]